MEIDDLNITERFNSLNKRYYNYELIKIERLTDLNSVGLLLKHTKSGARVAVISCDDDNKVFSIGFKTPPTDDTGTQHIIEHSTLCGSKKYPVKDPFVELCKGSLNTFLNAMTYPDKTVYPVASCNLVDFKNIMDVYLDAVFYPNIYEHEEIFKQEGWHYELEDIDGDITYNGVVYNEMKGVYSSADDILSRYTFSALFPDSEYKNESGGDPEVIPELTYDAFKEYHRGYYHPSNSYIYLYGDLDVCERLDYLDREYLCAFDKNEVNINSDITFQNSFDKPKTLVKKYAITEDEQLEDNTFLSYNVVCGTSTDPLNYLALQVLDYALVLAPGAPLKQALIDAGIGTDIDSSLETSMYQPIYSIVARNANESQKDEFEKVIKDTLADLADKGINERTLLAGINNFEFKYREADYGPYPKGLMYYLTMMDSWLYDENKPFIHIEAGETFKKVKELLGTGFFENMIKNYILDNNHAVTLLLVPEHGLDEKRELKTKEKLDEYKKTLSKEQLEQLIKDTKALKAYQDEPSSQEDLEKIPQLSLSDIGREPAKLYIDPKNIGDTKVIHHNIFTNKIGYMMLAFDCRKVPDELLPYVGLLSSCLGLMDTENYTYPELTNEININSGGISTDAAIYGDNIDFDKYSVFYEVKSKVLYDKFDFALNMIEEIIYHTKFNDFKRLKEITAKIRSRMEGSMMSAGHSLAITAAMSQFSKTARFSYLLRGYGFYEFIHDIDSNFDSKKEDIAKKLEILVNYIFDKGNLIVSFTADDEGYEKLVLPMTAFAKKLKKSDMDDAKREHTPKNEKLGLTSSSQVNYVARCGNFRKYGYSFTGAFKVLKVIFSYDYLWTNVRVKGGAYGCMSGFSRNGDVYMVSYRDPNLSKTNDVYEGAADFIKNFEVSDRDMVKFIIGTIGDIDSPLTPSAKGIRSFGAYICNTSIDMLKRERLEVLECNTQRIRELAELVRAAMDENYFVVVGNQKDIQTESTMFDTIKPLIISAN